MAQGDCSAQVAARSITRAAEPQSGDDRPKEAAPSSIASSFSAQAEFSEPKIRLHYENTISVTRISNERHPPGQRARQVREDVSASGLAWQLIHSAIGFALIKPLEIPGHATPATVEQAIGLLIEQLAGDRNSA
jgi:hypothetical protein